MSSRFFPNRLVPVGRVLLLIVGIAVCLWTIREAALFGASRLLTRSALAARSLAAAQVATDLTPADPQAHRARAALLIFYDTPADATIALEKTLSLRSADYALWITLGQLRDRTGDSQGALAAFNEAVNRAPFYAQPRWQRGNFLLRAGQYEAAFADLSLSVESNPEMLSNLMDLAWSLSKGNAKLTEDLVQIKSDKARLAFARFLAAKGKGAEALEQLKAVGTVPPETRKDLVSQLLTTNNFKEAFDIWSEGNEPTTVPAIYDGGFEGSLKLDDKGFGWRLSAESKSVGLALDPNQPHSGAQSLRIDLGGEHSPDLVAQLLLVQPSTRYQVSFAARTQDLVTGGPPLAVVTDAGGERKRLGQSATLTKDTKDWRTFNFEFTTLPTTSAVMLSLQREPCSSGPCPAFGSVLLDSFSIRSLR